MDKVLTIGIFTSYLPYVNPLLCHLLAIYVSIPADVHISAYEDQLAPAVVDDQFILDHLVIDTREEDLVVILSLYISSS